MVHWVLNHLQCPSEPITLGPGLSASTKELYLPDAEKGEGRCSLLLAKTRTWFMNELLVSIPGQPPTNPITYNKFNTSCYQMFTIWIYIQHLLTFLKKPPWGAEYAVLGAQKSLQIAGQRLAFWDVGPKDASGREGGLGQGLGHPKEIPKVPWRFNTFFGIRVGVQ